MKIFRFILISNIAAKDRADDNVTLSNQIVEIQQRAFKLFGEGERWRNNMRKNINSITEAMMRIVTRNKILLLFPINKIIFINHST